MKWAWPCLGFDKSIWDFSIRVKLVDLSFFYLSKISENANSQDARQNKSSKASQISMILTYKVDGTVLP